MMLLNIEDLVEGKVIGKVKFEKKRFTFVQPLPEELEEFFEGLNEEQLVYRRTGYRVDDTFFEDYQIVRADEPEYLAAVREIIPYPYYFEVP